MDSIVNGLKKVVDGASGQQKGFMLDRSQRVLPPAVPRKTKGGVVVRVVDKINAAQKEDASAIASPLTESETIARQYYNQDQFVSPDGWLVFNSRQVKQITMTDAKLNEVVFNYKSVAPAPAPTTP